jgi:hypothetical protein
MSYYLKVAGYIILGYIVLWLIFMILMGTKMYLDLYGYPSIAGFMKLIYGL